MGLVKHHLIGATLMLLLIAASLVLVETSHAATAACAGSPPTGGYPEPYTGGSSYHKGGPNSLNPELDAWIGEGYDGVIFRHVYPGFTIYQPANNSTVISDTTTTTYFGPDVPDDPNCPGQLNISPNGAHYGEVSTGHAIFSHALVTFTGSVETRLLSDGTTITEKKAYKVVLICDNIGCDSLKGPSPFPEPPDDPFTPPAPPPAPLPEVAFDWSAPERFDGTAATYATTAPQVTPRSWPRIFTVTEGCAEGAVTWRVEPALATAPTQEDSCTWRLDFPAEGEYRVTLDVTAPAGATVSKTETVKVEDWLVVSLGDSVASGEGVPAVPGVCRWDGLVTTTSAPCDPHERWQSAACHRSTLAGPAVAARRLELADPRASVTFVHLACSGATVDQGLLGPYRPGVEPLSGRMWPAQPAQIPLARQLRGRRSVDVALLSIGANDIDFGGLVKDCVILPDCRNAKTPVATSRLARQAARYARVNASIGTALGLAEPSDLVITDYFDPTVGANGSACTMFDDHRFGQAFNIGRAESQWAATTIVGGLNTQIALASGRYGWTQVAGIAGAFHGHGYCAAAGARWIRTLREAMTGQGDQSGAVHPNEAGHRYYGERLDGTVRALLGL